MTALTAAQLTWLHDEVGAGVTDAALQADYDRAGNIRDVAVAVLRRRRNGWLASPLKATLTGVGTVDFSANIAAVDRRVLQLTQLDDDPLDDGPAAADEGDALAIYPLARWRGR